jgi:hypothetical protein
MVQLNGKLLYGHTVNPIEQVPVNGCRQEVEKIKNIAANRNAAQPPLQRPPTGF